MGPPGSFRAENANALKEQFSWKVIHTGELLKQQAEKKNTDIGKAISESFKSYQYGKLFPSYCLLTKALFFSWRSNRYRYGWRVDLAGRIVGQKLDYSRIP